MEAFSALLATGEFTGHWWTPRTKVSDAEPWCFLYLRLNKRLSKHSWGWRFETPSRPLWHHSNVLQLSLVTGYDASGADAARSAQFTVVMCLPEILLSLPRMQINPLNTLKPRQNGRHFADDIFKCIFLNENAWISLEISLKFVPKVQINNIPALVQIMAWRRPGDKPFSEPMVVSLPTHICITRPQWVDVGLLAVINVCSPDSLLQHSHRCIILFSGSVLRCGSCYVSHILCTVLYLVLLFFHILPASFHVHLKRLPISVK